MQNLMKDFDGEFVKQSSILIGQSWHYAINATGYLSYYTAVTVSCVLLKVNLSALARHKNGGSGRFRVRGPDPPASGPDPLNGKLFRTLPDPRVEPTRDQLWANHELTLTNAKLTQTNPDRNLWGISGSFVKTLVIRCYAIRVLHLIAHHLLSTSIRANNQT